MTLKTLTMLVITMFTLNTMAEVKTITIDQKDKKFSESEIELNVGDVLVFKNSDPFQHNVYSLSKDNSFELKVQKPGESTPVPLKKGKFKKGEMLVECAIHPTMKLKVKINDANDAGEKKEKKKSKKTAAK